MKKFLLLFSHTLVEKQEKEIYEVLKCAQIIKLPRELQTEFSQVKYEKIEDILKKIEKYIDDNLSSDDYVLVQGHPGLTYEIIKSCKKRHLRPVYSQTPRDSYDIVTEEQIEKISYFYHEKFYEY